jgi:hypothetical protein
MNKSVVIAVLVAAILAPTASAHFGDVWFQNKKNAESSVVDLWSFEDPVACWAHPTAHKLTNGSRTSYDHFACIAWSKVTNRACWMTLHITGSAYESAVLTTFKGAEYDWDMDGYPSCSARDIHRIPVSGSAGSAAGSSGGASAKTIADAAFLPSVTRWKGVSAKQKVLSEATYRFSKLIGRPRTLAVFCWSDRDWPGISGDGNDPLYGTFGFFSPRHPHWIHLSPSTCRSLQTLLTSRPLYPNRFLADGVDTLAHEMIHALGISSEARTECLSMQTTKLMAINLKVPMHYSSRLGRLTLQNYLDLPARYVDPTRCREGGTWDLYPNEPSPPWHDAG